MYSGSRSSFYRFGALFCFRKCFKWERPSQNLLWRQTTSTLQHVCYKQLQSFFSFFSLSLLFSSFRIRATIMQWIDSWWIPETVSLGFIKIKLDLECENANQVWHDARIQSIIKLTKCNNIHTNYINQVLQK